MYLKTSLHVGFTVYLAFLVYPLNPVIAVAVLIFTIFLGWSRVVLGRHTPKEVLCGAALGLLAGGSFLLALYR
jgi:membrane-associated phospholipid phosphatase